MKCAIIPFEGFSLRRRRRHSEEKAMNDSISFFENERFTSSLVSERIMDDGDKIVDGHKHEGSML